MQQSVLKENYLFKANFHQKMYQQSYLNISCPWLVQIGRPYSRMGAALNTLRVVSGCQDINLDMQTSWIKKFAQSWFASSCTYTVVASQEIMIAARSAAHCLINDIAFCLHLRA